MDFPRLEKGDLIKVVFKDHFSFAPDVTAEEVKADRRVKGTMGFEVIGWLEDEDEDYIYVRFVRPLPKGFTPLAGGDGGFAILKAAIVETKVIREGGK